MGIIILFVCASIALAFLSGMLCMIMSDSCVYDDSTEDKDLRTSYLKYLSEY